MNILVYDGAGFQQGQARMQVGSPTPLKFESGQAFLFPVKQGLIGFQRTGGPRRLGGRKRGYLLFDHIIDLLRAALLSVRLFLMSHFLRNSPM